MEKLVFETLNTNLKVTILGRKMIVNIHGKSLAHNTDFRNHLNEITLLFTQLAKEISEKEKKTKYE